MVHIKRSLFCRQSLQMLNDIKRECLEIRLNQARGLATCGYLWPIIGQCYTVVKVTVTCLAVLEPGSVTVVTTASQGDRQLPPLHKLVQGIYAHQQVDLENTITEGLNQQLHNHTEVMWTCHNKGVVSNYTHWLEQPQSESGIISKGHQKMNSITDGLSISTPSAMIGSSYYDVSSLADAETDKSFHSHTSISTFAIITQSFHFHQHVTTNGWYQSTQLSYGVTSSRIITCTKCRNYTKKPHRRPPKAPPSWIQGWTPSMAQGDSLKAEMCQCCILPKWIAKKCLHNVYFATTSIDMIVSVCGLSW